MQRRWVKRSADSERPSFWCMILCVFITAHNGPECDGGARVNTASTHMFEHSAQCTSNKKGVVFHSLGKSMSQLVRIRPTQTEHQLHHSAVHTDAILLIWIYTCLL